MENAPALKELLNSRIFAWDKRDGIYITIE